MANVLDLRGTAAEILANLRETRAVQPLIGLLDDKHIPTAQSAAQALGKIGDARATDPLLRVKRTGDKTLRENCRRALRAIRPWWHFW